MYKIEKIIDECDDDILPEVEDTALGEDYDEIMLINKKGKKQIRFLYFLYCAVRERENYYKTHTATAFGNPDLAYLKGKVWGLCIAEDVEETETEDSIIFIKNNRKILIVDKISKEAFKESQRDVNKTLAELGF